MLPSNMSGAEKRPAAQCDCFPVKFLFPKQLPSETSLGADPYLAKVKMAHLDHVGLGACGSTLFFSLYLLICLSLALSRLLSCRLALSLLPSPPLPSSGSPIQLYYDRTTVLNGWFFYACVRGFVLQSVASDIIASLSQQKWLRVFARCPNAHSMWYVTYVCM